MADRMKENKNLVMKINFEVSTIPHIGNCGATRQSKKKTLHYLYKNSLNIYKDQIILKMSIRSLSYGR